MNAFHMEQMTFDNDCVQQWMGNITQLNMSWNQHKQKRQIKPRIPNKTKPSGVCFENVVAWLLHVHVVLCIRQ